MNSGTGNSSLRITSVTGHDTPSEFNLAIGVLASIFFFLPVAILVSLVVENPPIDALVDLTILPPKDFRPEASEHAIYLAGLVYFPVALLLWHLISQRLLTPGKVIFRQLLSWGLLLPIIWLFLPLSFYLAMPGTWNKSAYAVLGMTELGLTTGFNVALVAGIFGVIWKLRSRVLVDLISALLIGLLGSMTVFGENDPQAASIHLQVLMSPFVQVMQGDTLLVDLPSQYGLSPQLLAPIFHVTGLSILSFTIVMSLLSSISLLLIYLTMRRLVTNPVLLLLGFSALVSLVCFWCRFMGLDESGVDPYFQYWPVRTLFPTIAMAFVIQHVASPSAVTRWAGHILMSLGCLWNLDSGLPAWGAWVAYLLYRATHWRGFIHEATVALGILGVVIATYMLAVWLSSGQWPSAGLMFASHKVFTYAGYYMLPAKVIHPWNLVVIVYIAAMCWSTRVWLGERHADGAIVFFLTVLGAGLFTYYVGRSHDLVFPVTTYPMFVIVLVYLNKLLSTGKESGPLRRSAGFIAASLMFILTVGMIGKLAILSEQALRRSAAISSPRNERATQIVELVEQKSGGAEKLLFLSDHATYWHLLTNTAATNNDNLATMFYQTEIDELALALVRGDTPVFVDGYFDQPRRDKRNSVYQQLLSTLREAGYQPLAVTKDQTFSYWSIPH